MKESLGLNISNNFIRYAKIQNDGNKIKVKALGVKIYDRNPKAVINQIIQETKSEKAIINTNTINEEYYYSRIYTNKKIDKQDIDFEFSEYCIKNNIFNELQMQVNKYIKGLTLNNVNCKATENGLEIECEVEIDERI